MKFGHLEGVPQPQLGDLLTMGYYTLTNWDDPPSMPSQKPTTQATSPQNQRLEDEISCGDDLFVF